MPFCRSCGNQLTPGANFCAGCGTPVTGMMPAQSEMVVRCPNCGSSVSRLTATCSYCGAQIVNKEASKTVKQFAEELVKIEAEAPETKQAKGLFSSYAKTINQSYGDKTFERKVSLIKSFPIPNTVEEISEFVLLAVANIDTKYGRKSVYNSLWGVPGGNIYRDVTLATTWVNKLEQAYNKALISFPNDPIFHKIQNIYEDKMRELNRM